MLTATIKQRHVATNNYYLVIIILFKRGIALIYQPPNDLDVSLSDEIERKPTLSKFN